MAVICGTPTPDTTRVVQIDPGANSDPQRVGARVNQGLGAVGGGHVAGDHLDIGAFAFGRYQRRNHVVRVAVRRVDTQRVNAGAPQRRDALGAVGSHSNRGAHPQASQAVLARRGIAHRFVHVLDRDQPAQPLLIVDQRQLFNSMGLQDVLGRIQVDAQFGGDHLGRHQLAHRLVQPLDEAQVAIGKHPHQTVLADHRQA